MVDSSQCSKLPVAWSPLATNFSRWRQPTCDLVAKKKRKKKKNRAVANLSQRRRADRERAIFLAFFRFGLIENETRIAKLPHLSRVCEVLQSSTVQSLLRSWGINAQQVLSTRALTCKMDNKETPCPNTQLESRFTFLRLPHDVAKEGDPERTFFLSVSVRSRTRHEFETLTCHVHARCYSAVFSATSLSTRVVERTKTSKRHI